MSVICGINTNNTVYLASDSRVSFESEKHDWFEKIFIAGKFVVAVCGVAKQASLVQHIIKKLEAKDKPYDVPLFARKLRDAMFNDDWSPIKENGCPLTFDVSALVFDGTSLWLIGNDGFVVPIPEDKFYASGSGAPYAYGAWYVSSKENIRETLISSVKAAIAYDSNCGGEVKVKSFALPVNTLKPAPIQPNVDLPTPPFGRTSLHIEIPPHLSWNKNTSSKG